MSDNCCHAEPRHCLEKSAYLKSLLCFVGLATETALCVCLVDQPRSEILSTCKEERVVCNDCRSDVQRRCCVVTEDPRLEVTLTELRAAPKARDFRSGCYVGLVQVIVGFSGQKSMMSSLLWTF
jgi:hypothetical protein